MALSDYTPERATINYKGSALLSVRGLSFDDLSVLIRQHMASFTILFDGFKSRDTTIGTDLFFMELITSFPNVVFDVIAISADEPEYASTARKLPMALQIVILQEITRLTFEDIGGPKAFVALVNGIVQKLLPNAPKMPSISSVSNES